MTVKQWNVGDVLTAADLNAWTVPLAGVKSANQTIQSQVTFVNDADLRIAMPISATYQFHCLVRFSSGTGQDLKISTSVPTGGTCRYAVYRDDLSSNFQGPGDFDSTDVVTIRGAGVGVIRTAVVIGVAWTTTTAGNLILQWAQNTSGAFNTTVYTKSWMVANRIG